MTELTCSSVLMISQYMMDTDAPKYSKAFQFFIL